MVYVFWDTSTLIKRYLPEAGSVLVERVFDDVPTTRMTAVSLTMGEMISVAVRCRNSGRLPDREFGPVIVEVQRGVFGDPDFKWIDVDQAFIRESLRQILEHSINATDAIILQSAIGLSRNVAQTGDTLLLVASDARLVGAARAEGLTVFNPETDTEAQLDALLAG